MSKLDIFISFLDRTFGLLTLPNGNIASRPLQQTEFSSDNKITAITNLLNSSLLVTGNSSGDITVWSASTGSKIRKISAHTSRINALCGLPTGHLATGSYELTIKIWNVIGEEPLVKLLPGDIGFVYSLSVLPNGFLASSDTHNNISIWDTATGSLIKTITSHSELVQSLSILFTNQYLLEAKCLENLKIWSPNGLHLATIDEKNAKCQISAICAVSNDFIASGDLNDNKIKIWNSNTGDLVRILTGHLNSVTSLYVLPNGFLISGSTDSLINIWDPNSGELIKTLNE